MTSSCIGRIFCNRIAPQEDIDNLTPDMAMRRLVLQATAKRKGINNQECFKIIHLYAQCSNEKKIFLLNNFIEITKNNHEALEFAYLQIFRKKQSIDYAMLRLISELNSEYQIGTFRTSEYFIKNMIQEFEGVKPPEISEGSDVSEIVGQQSVEGKKLGGFWSEEVGIMQSCEDMDKEGVNESLVSNENDGYLEDDRKTVFENDLMKAKLLAAFSKN